MSLRFRGEAHQASVSQRPPWSTGGTPEAIQCLPVSVAHCRSLNVSGGECSDAYSDGPATGFSLNSSALRQLYARCSPTSIGAYHLPRLGAGFFMSDLGSRCADLEGTR